LTQKCNKYYYFVNTQEKIYIWNDDSVFAADFMIGSDAVFAADFCIGSDAVFAADFCIGSDTVSVLKK